MSLWVQQRNFGYLRGRVGDYLTSMRHRQQRRTRTGRTRLFLLLIVFRSRRISRVSVVLCAGVTCYFYPPPPVKNILGYYYPPPLPGKIFHGFNVSSIFALLTFNRNTANGATVCTPSLNPHGAFVNELISKISLTMGNSY